jgi:hypothetical protein
MTLRFGKGRKEWGWWRERKREGGKEKQGEGGRGRE